jgi:hypothetical protein
LSVINTDFIIGIVGMPATARVLSCKHLVLPTTGIEKKRLFDIHLLFLIISLLFVLKCWFFFENISAGSD